MRPANSLELIMLNALLQVPEVQLYLRAFPRAQWDRCLTLTLQLGIKAAQDLCPYEVTLEALGKLLVPGGTTVREQLAQLRASLESRKSLGEVRSKPGLRDRQLRVPSAGEQGLQQPPLRLTSRASAETATSDFKSVPKYLKVVESKIKAQVLRDIQRFKKGEISYELPAKPVSSPARPQPASVRHSFPTFYSPDSSGLGSMLAEPRTNEAFVERLVGKPTPRYSDSHYSVLRIADDFLSDPLMASLSSHNSPKFEGGRR